MGMSKANGSSSEVAVNSLVQTIHDSPGKMVLALAGAGHSALSHLLDVAGASRTLLEALVPYSNAAFNDFLAYAPAQYVASRTANLMAGRAHTRARQLAADPEPLLGIGCTATIATDRQKRGEHRAHVAVRTQDQLTEWYLLLEKGTRARGGEEDLVGKLILNAIAHTLQLPARVAFPIGAGDRFERKAVSYMPVINQLIEGKTRVIGIQDSGQLHHTSTAQPVVLSGSFNPLHEGHLGMARAAERMLGARVAFELSAVNVDKPPLPATTILERMAQFAGRAAVFASDAPTYLEKAELYPGTTFVVGYDTAVRIFAPRYYNNSGDEMAAALNVIRAHGCHFLVAGRVDDSGQFRNLQDIEFPVEFQDLFTAIPEDQFRLDISSTALRAANATGSR